MEYLELLCEKHQRGVGVVHRYVGVLFHSASGLRQIFSLAEIKDLKPAVSDELGKESGASADRGKEVHSLRNHRAGGESLSFEGVEPGCNPGMVLFRRIEVSDDRTGVKKPGSQGRQLRSRIFLRHASEVSGGDLRRPCRCPIRTDIGRSSRASLRISRASSEIVLPCRAARFRSASRSFSSVRIVNVVRMSTVYYKTASARSSRPRIYWSQEDQDRRRLSETPPPHPRMRSGKEPIR